MAKLTREDVEQIVKEAGKRGQWPNFSKANLSETNLSQMDLTGAIFRSTNLVGADLTKTNLHSADLRRANLIRADLYEADLTGADLNEANLSRGDQWEMEIANLSGEDLGEAYMTSGVQLSRTNFSWAKLCNTNLSGADLSEANLTGADLNSANLIEALLYEVNFDGTNLVKTDFSNADLGDAKFHRTNLNKADFTNVKMERTIFLDVDLSVVKGLDSVLHRGPSYIDIYTLYRSRGNISEVFLRGIGAPDIFITYAASLTGEAIQYYSCFISHSSQDEAFAQRLHADFQQKGVRCWFAPEDMKIGDKIRLAIDQSIRIHDKLLIILSENSLNSEWVESEVERAFEEERKRKQTVLFPVRLDEAVMETNQPWAAEIRRTRHIGDFSRWRDHDAYQAAFERLLRDLKAEG